eukprot:gene8689-17948_t
MSSKMERKAKGLNRLLKREARSGHKKKRKNGLDSDSDGDNDGPGYLPTPAQMAAVALGQNVISLKKKKRKSESSSNSQVSLHPDQIPLPNFSRCKAFKKNFWTGAPGEDPVSDELKILRKTFGILPKGPLELCPPPVTEITSPGVPTSFAEVFSILNIQTPSPVQMQCWPAILVGANVLCIAPTGSGKTLAYSLPMIPHISAQIQANINITPPIPSPYALVLVPTRELAIQVAAVLKPLKRLSSIRSLAIYGGQDKEIQLQNLTSFGHTHIIVATPGRLLDLIATKKITLTQVSYLVLDEADRMLSLGFEQWLDESVVIRISTVELDHNNHHHTAIANAAAYTSTNAINNGDDSDVNDEDTDHQAQHTSQSQPIKNKSKDALTSTSTTTTNNNNEIPEENPADNDLNPITSTSTSTSKTAKDSWADSSLTISKSITQHIHICAAHKKPRLLMRFIEKVRGKEKEEKVRQSGAMLIFCTKIKSAHFVCEFLKKQNIVCDELHGQLSQQQRELRLQNFKAGKLRILCATDVAARGIHIKHLQYVVNYDFPSTLEQYCHRVGRTGRQGECGETYSLLTRNMAPLTEDLIKLLESCNQTIEPNLQKLADEYSSGNFVEDQEESEAIDHQADDEE